MKNYLVYLITLGALLVSCDAIDPLKEERDAYVPKIVQKIDIELSDDDFSTLYDRIIYLNPADSLNAQFLLANKYFTDSIPAADYAPMVLDVNYPNLGPGTQAKVSYNFNGEAPAELNKIVTERVYTVSDDDYTNVNEQVSHLRQFMPAYSPDVYLPSILKYNVTPDHEEDTIAVKYNYTNNNATVDLAQETINIEFSERFSNDTLGKFSSYNESGNDQWAFSYAGNGSAYINGYDGSNYNNNDAWLISNRIDLSNLSNTHLQFSHAVGYFETGCLFVRVSRNFDGINISEASWSTIYVNDPLSSDINDFKWTDAIDVSEFDGDMVNVAFQYVSSSNPAKAPEWTINEFIIGEFGYKVSGDKEVFEATDYYKLEDNNWKKLESIYVFRPKDYEYLGITEFSKSNHPADLIPTILQKDFPTAQEDKVVNVLYQYNTDEELILMADSYTNKEATWVSSYNYIQWITEPYTTSDDGWAFDPTVKITMGNDDYKIIVDYVKNSPNLDDNSSYPESEYYYGASYYYDNFDTRGGKQSGDFDTWDQAIIEAIGEVYLPLRFPDAITTYKGIDMKYLVTFATYGAPFTNYTILFQCTKAGPNPEFTLVEGPTGL